MTQKNKSPLGIFERYLSIWVGLCIVFGIMLGHLLPSAFQSIAHFEYANVNFVIAVFIWVMIYPMMVNVDFSKIKEVTKQPKAFVISFIVTWLIMPFSMVALGVLFLQNIFADFISVEDSKQYVAGLILLGAAPCTAMVFVWSKLADGNANYTLVQVALNNIIMIFAYAPIVAFLLGATDITIPWDTLILSVVLYVLIPMLAGYFTRKKLSEQKLNSFLNHLKPYSVIGLLATVVLLFGFQAETLLQKPLVIAMIGLPIIIQSFLMFGLAYFLMCKAKIRHDIAAPASFISASNFFELAVAVAISLFGLNSGAALATVVGVLVEVPVMLWLVNIANKTKNKFIL
ncbi:MAG: ACR3 family arsenite efflux transporter [Rickettsiales bacterium]|nr:ACR3 family arsenite efflux transporter [Rickettsiales bacterium]